MLKAGQVKSERRYDRNIQSKKYFASNVRLNLNDLLQKRREEKRIDKKTNILILSGASAVAVVILALLSL